MTLWFFGAANLIFISRCLERVGDHSPTSPKTRFTRLPLKTFVTKPSRRPADKSRFAMRR